MFISAVSIQVGNFRHNVFMPKVTPLNDECYGPRVFLSELMEAVDEIESIVTIIKERDEDCYRIAYSRLSVQQLCFLSKILDDHIRDRMEEVTIDNY